LPKGNNQSFERR